MATPTSNEKVRVLLIDDDPDDHVLTRDLFAEIPGEKFELECISDYEAGIDAICSGNHDVYLLDYRLGDKTGLELLAEALRSAGAEVIGMLAVFTYGFPQAERAFAAANIPLLCLSDYPALLTEAEARGVVGANELAHLNAWREAPEVWGK